MLRTLKYAVVLTYTENDLSDYAGVLSSQLIEESHCCDDASKLEVIVLRCFKLLTGQGN